MNRLRSIVLLVVLLTCPTQARSQENRAPRPVFSNDQIRGIFFDSLDQAFRGPRPSIWSSPKELDRPVPAVVEPPKAEATAGRRWARLVGPATIEDEVKRIRNEFNAVITTPSAFNSGGFQQARVHLTALATLFEVIDQHSSDVRWKRDAGAARSLFARTAFNCKAGSTQVYNEAKRRKTDLQDLVSGTRLSTADGQDNGDWSSIADRVPLMQYAESTLESLKESTRDEASLSADADAVRRQAEVLAMLGEVFASPGMDDADDPDYAALARELSNAAHQVAALLGDNLPSDELAANVRRSVSGIQTRCDACHEEWR